MRQRDRFSQRALGRKGQAPVIGLDTNVLVRNFSFDDTRQSTSAGAARIDGMTLLE